MHSGKLATRRGTSRRNSTQHVAFPCGFPCVWLSGFCTWPAPAPGRRFPKTWAPLLVLAPLRARPRSAEGCAAEGSGHPNLEFPAVQYPELIFLLIKEEEVLRKNKKIKIAEARGCGRLSESQPASAGALPPGSGTCLAPTPRPQRSAAASPLGDSRYGFELPLCQEQSAELLRQLPGWARKGFPAELGHCSFTGKAS